MRILHSEPGNSSNTSLRQNFPDSRATVLHGSMSVTAASARRSGMQAAVCTAPPSKNLARKVDFNGRR
jgi:hypothetical protein